MKKNNEEIIISFKNYICSRPEELSEKYLENEEYQNTADEQEKLYAEIKTLLPEEATHLVLKYSDVSNSLMGIAEEVMYERGFMDALKLFYTITK